MSQFSENWGNYLLKDIVETTMPETISWWPSTLGWKFVVVIILLFSLNKLLKSVQRYRHNIYRRQALTWLESIPDSHNEQSDGIYRQIPALVRLTALKATSRREISNLNKAQWDLWLDKQCPACNFATTFPKYLHLLAYSPTFSLPQSEMTAFITEVKIWIKQHRNNYD